MRTSLTAAMYRAFDLPLPEIPTHESATAHLHRAGSHLTPATVVLNGSAGSHDVNCFRVDGSIQLDKLCAFVTDATALSNCTASYFNMWDGADEIALTKNNGVLSGLLAESLVVKDAVALNTWALGDNVAGFYIEPAAGVFAFQPGIVGQKSGNDTFIRFSYTTNLNPIAAVLTVCLEWRPLDSGFVTAV